MSDVADRRRYVESLNAQGFPLHGRIAQLASASLFSPYSTRVGSPTNILSLPSDRTASAAIAPSLLFVADLSIQFDGTNLEVDSDGRDVGLGVGVISESQQETGLADA